MNKLKNISPEGRSIGYIKNKNSGDTTYIITLVDQVFILAKNEQGGSTSIVDTFKYGDIIKLYSFGKALNFDQIKEFAECNNITNYSINGNTINMNWSKNNSLMIKESWVENNTKVYQWKVGFITNKGEVVPIKDNSDLITPGVYELTNTENTTLMRRKPDYINVSNFIRMCGVLRRGNLCRSTLVFINDVIFD